MPVSQGVPRRSERGAGPAHRRARRSDARERTARRSRTARRTAVAADAVGYPQALAYLRGFSTLPELRTHLVRATRRYAKRQATWFRTEPDLERVASADAHAQIVALARTLPGWDGAGDFRQQA